MVPWEGPSQRPFSKLRKLNPAFHEQAALDLLARDGIGVIWKLHLDAANAYGGGFLNGAEILLATADAAERLIRHTATSNLVWKIVRP